MDELLKAFRLRQRAHPDGHWLYGNQASRAYDLLVRVWDIQPFIDLALSGMLTDLEIVELYHYGGHGGSVSKKDNPLLVVTNKIIRETCFDRMPPMFQEYLNWLEEVHGY